VYDILTHSPCGPFPVTHSVYSHYPIIRQRHDQPNRDPQPIDQSVSCDATSLSLPTQAPSFFHNQSVFQVGNPFPSADIISGIV
jgi:hypothetical protein